LSVHFGKTEECQWQERIGGEGGGGERGGGGEEGEEEEEEMTRIAQFGLRFGQDADRTPVVII